MTVESSRTPEVYVDATISHVENPNLSREGFVAYVVEDPPLKKVRPSSAKESFEGELDAILFAIEELEDKLSRFVIFCDHESVVSEVNREPRNAPGGRPLLQAVRSHLLANPSITVKLFRTDPADRYLKDFLRTRDP